MKLSSRRTLSALLSILCAALLPPAAVYAAAPDCTGISTVNNVVLDDPTVISGLSVPVFVTSPPNDPDRFFIVQQNGEIILHKRGDAPSVNTVFMNISDDVGGPVFFSGEAGLLSMAFDPDFGDGTGLNDFFYVNYYEGSFFSGRTVVARYELLSADVGDPNSELRILEFSQPESNHNGGLLLFDDDGYLFVFTGDGGGANDNHGVCGNSQNLTNLLGKILRVDVKGIDPLGSAPDTSCSTAFFTGQGYTNPTGNIDDSAGGACDEIWEYGLRNPWRASFDRTTGDLYNGDVGQNCWEEINYVAAADLGGTNYGWRVKEGNQCFDPALATTSCDPAGVTCPGSPNCNDPSLVDPIFEYENPTVGDAVVGGYVYRGCRMPNFDGTYFWGDNGSGTIRSFEVVGGVRQNDLNLDGQIGRSPGVFTSFGEDARGEIYMADAGAGAIYKITAPFSDFTVSGDNAGTPFELTRDGNWSWEDMFFETMLPVDFYRVYRGTPGGTFDCIHSTTDTGWVAGDPTLPAAGQVLGYIVTAVQGPSETQSGNPPRTLANPCPAP